MEDIFIEGRYSYRGSERQIKAGVGDADDDSPRKQDVRIWNQWRINMGNCSIQRKMLLQSKSLDQWERSSSTRVR